MLGVEPERHPLKEIDYRALRLLMERSRGPEISKRREIRKFDIAWRKGLLHHSFKDSEQTRWMRCEARFCLGDYSDWSGWQYRDPYAARIWTDNPFKVPVWNLAPVDRLYITGEQGLGDEVLLSQCIENCKPLVKDIVFETQARLIPIFERSLGVQCVPANVNRDGFRMAQPFQADAWVALGELPRAFRRKWSDFPRVPHIKSLYVNGEFNNRVGLSWRGAQGTIDWRELKALYPDGVSFQYDHDDEDIERPDFDLRNDIESILAALAGLKKLVTVSTTVAHLASALGVPVDLIVADKGTGIRSFIMPWRWLDLSQQAVPKRAWWYGDNVRVFTSFREYKAHQ